MAIDAGVQFTNQLARVAVNSAIEGASYYLGAQWFTTIPAPTAALFGFTAAAVNLVTESLFNQVFARPGANDASKAIGWIATAITNTVTAALIVKLVTNYTITLGAAFTLTLSAIVAGCVVLLFLNICGCRNLLN